MRILVCGASGMLGKDITNLLASRPDNRVYALFRKPIAMNYFTNPAIEFVCHNLNDHEFIKQELNEIDPEVIINCAALVDVDACETNTDAANLLHAETACFLAKFCPDALYIYISSDSVFNGKEGNYLESDLPDPLNNYSITKLKGEEYILKHSNYPVVIRTNIYGFHYLPGNSLAEFGLENLKSNSLISGFSDVHFNPLYTGQLANIIKDIIDDPQYGILHAGSNEVISKFHFLKALAQVFGYNPDLIIPASIQQHEFVAKRPLNTSLNTQKLTAYMKKEYTLNDGLQMLLWDMNVFNK
jgi:dTDP-4-dehydrorhamnose reductase